jgi:hypothetical protein
MMPPNWPWTKKEELRTGELKTPLTSTEPTHFKA